jgi:hypothetical protein
MGKGGKGRKVNNRFFVCVFVCVCEMRKNYKSGGKAINLKGVRKKNSGFLNTYF